jgi:hypothetical protein
MADEENLGAAPAMPLQLAREIARQGEARLTALVNLGTAADLRATTLCGIFGASAVAIGAAVLAGIASGHSIPALIAGGTIVSTGLFLAAIIVAHAGAPQDFYVAGGNPDVLRQWSWDTDKWRSETEMLDATADRYARSIAANSQNTRARERASKGGAVGCRRVASHWDSGSGVLDIL